MKIKAYELKSLVEKKKYAAYLIYGQNKGSAIFIHLSTKKYAPTKGCVSISLNDMKKILSYNIKKIKII